MQLLAHTQVSSSCSDHTLMKKRNCSKQRFTPSIEVSYHKGPQKFPLPTTATLNYRSSLLRSSSLSWYHPYLSVMSPRVLDTSKVNLWLTFQTKQATLQQLPFLNSPILLNPLTLSHFHTQQAGLIHISRFREDIRRYYVNEDIKKQGCYSTWSVYS